MQKEKIIRRKMPTKWLSSFPPIESSCEYPLSCLLTGVTQSKSSSDQQIQPDWDFSESRKSREKILNITIEMRFMPE